MAPDADDALWDPLVRDGTRWCAPNVSATAHWLHVDGLRWRVALTRPAPRNCYVVSATGQYLDYARDEIRRLPSATWRAGSHLALTAIAPLLRALDPVVILDALPLSTVLHRARSRDAWAAAIDAAQRTYPASPIVIRSLDGTACPDALAALPTLGMHLVPSRLVFHQDPRAAAFWRIRNVRHDVALAQREPMPSRVLTATDAPQIATLYWQLYGMKHSLLNPHFTPEWLAHGMAMGVLRGEGLVHDGRLAAAYLSYRVEDVMTNPVFGYDTALPQALGLYRRLSLLTMLAARRDGVRLHASSGAPGFKATRGGVATMEYHAVHLGGVPWRQRAAWRSLLRITTALAPALFRVAR